MSYLRTWLIEPALVVYASSSTEEFVQEPERLSLPLMDYLLGRITFGARLPLSQFRNICQWKYFQNSKKWLITYDMVSKYVSKVISLL